MNNMLLWMLTTTPGGDSDKGFTDIMKGDGTEMQKIWDTVVDAVTIVVWVIVAALAVVLVVKGITTALAVVKAADEPQVRQEKIASFKYMAIGIVIALIIATLFGAVLTLFGDQLANQLGFSTEVA